MPWGYVADAAADVDWGKVATAAAPALIGAAGSVIGSSLQSGAVQTAADAANRTQQQQLGQTRSDLTPWLTAGTNALAATQDLTGLNGPDAQAARGAMFQADPGYAFQQKQGLAAIDAAAAARGMLHSGATSKAEQQYGSDLANQSFSTWYNRLAAMAGQGQTSGTALGQFGTVTGQGVAQTLASGGAAQAGIYGNEFRGVGNALQSGLTNYGYATKQDGSGSFNFDKAGATTPNSLWDGSVSSGYGTGATANPLYTTPYVPSGQSAGFGY